MNKYSLSQAAIRDLDEISDYFSDFSIEAGERFVKRFDDKCRKLINFLILKVLNDIGFSVLELKKIPAFRWQELHKASILV